MTTKQTERGVDEQWQKKFLNAGTEKGLGNIKPPKSNEGWKVKVKDWWYELEEECSGMMHSQPELRRAILEDIIKEALAQKDAEVTEMLHKLHLRAIGKYEGDALENVKAQIKEFQTTPKD